MKENILPYKCKCGGTLIRSYAHVVFFDIDFGVKECDFCEQCYSEYLDDEVMAEIKKEVQKRKLLWKKDFSQ